MTYDPYRPSNLRRTELCPGSARLCVSVPEPPSSPDAEAGTDLHARIPPGVSLDDLAIADREIVEGCREIVRQYATAKYRQSTTYYEEPLNFAGVSAGTADVLIVTGEHVVVIDWKFGWNPVEIENLQVATYATLAMDQWYCNSATVVLWAPRTMREPTVFHFTGEDADGILARIKAIRETAEGTDALVLQASATACQYCPARAICPALRIEALAAVENGEITIRDDQAADYWRAATMAEKWGEAVKGQIRGMAHHGRNTGLGPPPGIKVGVRRGNRRVSDPQAFYDKVSHRFSIAQFLSACDVKVARLEESYARSRKDEGITLKAAKEEFAEMTVDIVRRDRESLVVSLAPAPVEEPEPQPQAIGE